MPNEPNEIGCDRKSLQIFQLLEPQKWILGLINSHFVLQTFVETSVLKKNYFLSFILSL